MKRIQLEPWTPYDKLSLASAVMRTGDQNWNAVARATRNIFEESTKYMIEEKRSPEWFSNKQCAAQYEALLKNIGPRRKKKSEKTGSDHIGESPTDIIMNAVRQECIEELKRSLASTQALYLKLHKEYEDIQAGKMDHKLEEMLEEYEAKEREREIKMKLKFKLGEKNTEIMENNINASLKSEENDIKKTLEKDAPVSEPAKTNLTTSPLLTSLLQSPSPLTRPSLPSNTSPTISLLLNSSPSVPSSDSPTLTKLLEATSTVIGSPISSMTTSTAILPITPKQDSSINNLINSAVSATTSTPTPITTQTASPALTLIPPVYVSPKEIDATVTQSSNTITASTSSSIICTKAATTVVTTCTSTPLVSVTSTPASAIATSTTDHSVASSPSISGDSEHVSEEVVIKDENASSQENKEILEIEEVVNPSTPEVVLEDLVHTVESEVVIDQETPTSKRKNAARRLHLEQIEETETDDEVMETVEQIIEKVEEAIIETVGKEPAELDLGHNQSSETDNLSDQIETLDLDSHAVELIVLGHNQGKVITIRHDTEISNEPSKSDPSADDVHALESFGDIENLVEEEVRTLEDELQEIEEVVEEEGEEEIVEEEIKLQEEIIEHEEIIEDKGLEEEISEECEENVVVSNIELEEIKVVEEKTEEILKEEEIKQEFPKNEELIIKIEEPLKPNPEECTIENEITCAEDINIEVKNKGSNNEITTQDEVELEEIRNVESLDIIETKAEEEAIVEEAPEEVVIAELVEEVVQAEKLQVKNINTNGKPAEKLTISEEHNFSIKQEIVEEENLEVSSMPELLEVTPIIVPKIEPVSIEKTDSLIAAVKLENKSDKVLNQEENIAAVGSRVKGGVLQETKDTIRSSGRSTEKQQPSSSTTSTSKEAGKSIKLEKDVVEKQSNADVKPGQETGKRRTGRKRYPLAGCAESKPNSPAPSSHSMEDDREYKAWKKSIMLVYNRLAAHKYASVFLKPITEAEATGYHNVVLRPMDLTTIKRNIETGVIRSTVEFQRDMILMAQNAMIYNKPDSLIFKMAEDMLADMMSQMEVMVQALGDGVPLWGDSDEKLLTRGRASKSQTDESGANKRRSLTDDTPVRRRQQQQQPEESAKKRKGQQSQEEISNGKKKSEEVKKKGDDISKKKSLDESTNKRKLLAEESSIKRKGQFDDSASKKKYSTDEAGSTRKRTQSDDTTSSTKKKLHTDDISSSHRKAHVDETPPTGKRKSHVEEQSKRKTEASSSKRKTHMDDTPSSSKRKTLHAEENTGGGSSGSKKKAHVDETTSNKRKRSSAAVVEESRSTSKRKRAEAT